MSSNAQSKSKGKFVTLVLMFMVLWSANAWATLTKTEVSQLYVTIFGRASEGEGNNYWQTNQPSMIATANTMLATPAARDYFGASLNSNQAYIEHVYLNTLNKTPADDSVGIAYWVGLLNSGASRGEVAVALVSVIKDYAPGGPSYNPNDLKTIAAYNQFENRVEVSNYMADTVQDTPSDWQTSTSFTKSLIVTDDFGTVTSAKQAVNILGGNTSGLAADVESFMDMISSAGEISPMVTELTTVLEEIMNGDSSAVVITPSLDSLDLNNLPSTINITADFGAGYTPQGSTSVYSGRALIDINNIAYSATGIRADAALTATNVQRDGQLILNGGMNLGLYIVPSGSDLSISASVNFLNLQSLEFQVNGGAELSMAITDGSISQPVTLTMNQLSTSGQSISGTITLTPNGDDIYDAFLNLSTQTGTVVGTIRFDGIQGDQTIISTPGDALQAEGYNVVINNLTIDSSICSEQLPFFSGNIVISGGGESSTIFFNNCAYTTN